MSISRRIQLRTILTITALCAARAALAHGGIDHDGDDVLRGPADWHEIWRTWGLEPGSIIGLAICGGLYVQGLWRLWGGGSATGGGIGRGVRVWQAGCFAGAWFTLFVALVSPLHPLGGVLFSAHMVQHELLMIVAAPLLVLGQPMAVFLKALPRGWAHALAAIGNAPAWLRVWRSITNPAVAWLIHAIALWTWHVPFLFDATLDNEWVHAAQHLSFLLSALLFWWAVIHGEDRRLGYGMAVLYLFTTALHSGALGAMLTFARTIWYPAYLHSTTTWGLTPLEDQQLGGLIMWVPAGIVYVVAALALFASWLRESERRAIKREQASDSTDVSLILSGRPASAGRNLT